MVSLNPLSQVTDYPSMLNKIALFTFFVALLMTWLVRANVSSIDSALAVLTIEVPVTRALSVPLGTALPPLVIAFLVRALKFHDRLSDLFSIRERFDIVEILYPLAFLSAASMNPKQIRAIRSHRKDLMAEDFYRYASSTPGEAVIDTHYITMALDQWAWYWILLEATALALASSAVITLLSGPNPASYGLLAFVLIAVGILQLMRRKSAEYAFQQVKLITDDLQRKNEIKTSFDALQS